MKRCCMCKRTRRLTSFHRRGDGHQSVCKECRSRMDADMYLQDPVRRKRNYKANMLAITLWARTLKVDKPCTDCRNVFHFSAMQWDHLPGFGKLSEVSELVRCGPSRARILAEIAKCELVCANCHAVRTYTRRLTESSSPGGETSPTH